MDTLMRTKKLEDLGFDRPKAEGLVLMMKASIDEEVAKKVDLERVETSLRIDMRVLRTDLENTETRLNTKIDNVEKGLKSEISELRSDMKIQHKDLLLYLGGLMVTLSGIVTGVLIGVLKP